MRESRERESRLRGKRIIERAVRTFGITRDPENAGYIIPDGRLLNFKTDSYSRGRDTDHREIYNAFTKQDRRRLPRILSEEVVPAEDCMSGTEEMLKFGRIGGIRLHFSRSRNKDDANDLCLSIDRRSPPTEKQIETIKSIVGRNRPSNILIDVDDEHGNEISTEKDFARVSDVEGVIDKAIKKAREGRK